MRRFLVMTLIVAWSVPALGGSPFQDLQPNARPHLKSIYSSVHDVQEFTKGESKGIALVFLGTECPVARQYLPRLNELSDEFRGQGVKILGIYSDVGTNVLDMAIHAHDAELLFPVFKDVDQRLANLLEVQTTPEVVVLNSKLEKVYQGAIDDQFKRHGRRTSATENYLHEAMLSLVNGQPLEQAYVPASGCPLERKAPQRAPKDLTYYKHVASIVQRRCQQCHREGGPAPFELLSYDDVAYNTEKIREVVIDRRMPPWHGILHPDFGKLANDQRLTEEELETLVSWIDGGAQEGNPADGPPPLKFPSDKEWQIGKPDYVFKMPQPFLVPKSGTLEYQFFRVKLDYKEDRWFRAVEIKPGSRQVVHHVTLHVAPSIKDQSFAGFASMAQLYGLTGEVAHLINDYVPGDPYNAKVYPAHQAVLIPKHSDLIFEVHYTPNGVKEVSDQSMVAFQWASQPPEEQVLTRVFRKATGRFRVPPYEPNYRVEDTYYFEHDVMLDAIRPHYHLRGRSYRLEMIQRNPHTDAIEERRTILSVPVFDQAWQRTYELETPIHLPAGTELLATGIFDNSELNPNNPDPSAEVVWGQQTTDEMFSTRFKYRLAKQTSPTKP